MCITLYIYIYTNYKKNSSIIVINVTNTKYMKLTYKNSNISTATNVTISLTINSSIKSITSAITLLYSGGITYSYPPCLAIAGKSKINSIKHKYIKHI